MLTKSKQALIDLQQTLQCGKCHQQYKDLLCLGHCEHWFCRSCAESNAGRPCPTCGIPTTAGKVHVDLQLSNIASLCSKMFDLINEAGSDANSKESRDSFVSLKNKHNFETPDKAGDTFEQSSLLLSSTGKRKEAKTREGKGAIKQFDKDICSAEKLSSSLNESLQAASNHSSRKRKMAVRTGNGKAEQNDTDMVASENGKKRLKARSLPVIDLANDVATPEPKRRRSGLFIRTACSEGKEQQIEKSTPKGKNRKGNVLQNEEIFTPNSKSSKESSKDDSDVTVVKMKQPQSAKKRTPADLEQLNLCKKNAKGETPLQVATIKLAMDEVVRLLDAGASPNVKDNAGWTPLHEAVCLGSEEIASLLITHGASVNSPGLDNQTPLHDAVSYNHVKCVRLLVANGANVYARNVHGHTPIDLACSACNDDIKALLLSASKAFALTNDDLPMLDESAKPLCFTGSNLTKGQNKRLIQCSRVLQAKLVEEVTQEVTHVITTVSGDEACTRTLKFLQGVVAGKWIVKLEWLEACCSKKERVPEKDFAVSGCVAHPRSFAPKRALENRLKQLPPLFDGCQVFFYGKFDFPSLHKEQLVSLVKLGGGVVLKREPHLHTLDDYPYTHPYHAQDSTSLADCTIYVIHDDTCPNPPSVQAHRMKCFPLSWLTDTIATFSFLDKK